MSLHNRKTVLFITIAEAGQSNSILALALELLTHPNINVHVASFPDLRKRTEELLGCERVVKTKHPDSNFTFREIDGWSFQEAGQSRGLDITTFPHPPLARAHDEGLSKTIATISCWNGRGTTRPHFWLSSPPIQTGYSSLTGTGAVFVEYVRLVESCKDIINAVNPGIVVVEAFFSAAVDACLSLNRRYIVNSPMALLDVARSLQPMWKTFFYYPL